MVKFKQSADHSDYMDSALLSGANFRIAAILKAEDGIHQGKKEPSEGSIPSNKPPVRVVMRDVLLSKYQDIRHDDVGTAISDIVKTEDSTSSVAVKVEPVIEDFALRSESLSYNSGHDQSHLVEVSAEDVAMRLTNPLAKVKKDTQLTWEVVSDRIKMVGLDRYPIDLDAETLNFAFNKYYLHNLYGGSFVDTFPHPEQTKVQIHGLNDFMCLILDWNPHAPVVPGNPGLFFQKEPVNLEQNGFMGKIYRLTVKVHRTPALWLYMGQYRLYPSDSLTKEEYASQRRAVKKTWAKDILVKSYGARVCARVFFRKTRGREPLEQEIYAIIEDKPKIAEVRSHLSTDDIMNAYARGEEAIGIYAMKCVGYDTEFQRILARNYKYYTPPEQKKKAKSEGTSKSKAVTKATKRKRAASVSASESVVPELPESDTDVEISRFETEKLEVDSDIEVLDHAPTSPRSRPRAKRVKTE